MPCRRPMGSRGGSVNRCFQAGKISPKPTHGNIGRRGAGLSPQFVGTCREKAVVFPQPGFRDSLFCIQQSFIRDFNRCFETPIIITEPPSSPGNATVLVDKYNTRHYKNSSRNPSSALQYVFFSAASRATRQQVAKHLTAFLIQQRAGARPTHHASPLWVSRRIKTGGSLVIPTVQQGTSPNHTTMRLPTQGYTFHSKIIHDVFLKSKWELAGSHQFMQRTPGPFIGHLECRCYFLFSLWRQWFLFLVSTAMNERAVKWRAFTTFLSISQKTFLGRHFLLRKGAQGTPCEVTEAEESTWPLATPGCEMSKKQKALNQVSRGRQRQSPFLNAVIVPLPSGANITFSFIFFFWQHGYELQNL